MTFGTMIREARIRQKLSQRDLANSVGVDFTYISKLENDRTDYPPREDVIRDLAICLDLDQDELIYASGRVTELDWIVIQALAKRYKKQLPDLLMAISKSDVAEKLLGGDL